MCVLGVQTKTVFLCKSIYFLILRLPFIFLYTPNWARVEALKCIEVCERVSCTYMSKHAPSVSMPQTGFEFGCYRLFSSQCGCEH